MKKITKILDIVIYVIEIENIIILKNLTNVSKNYENIILKKKS